VVENNLSVYHLSKHLGALAAFVLGSIGAGNAHACLNPFGCTPKNYDECVAEATKRPTELGVKLARQQCHAKWLQPQEERNAAERTAAAGKRAAIWEAVPGFDDAVATWIAKLGQPDMVLGPYRCSSIKDAKLPAVNCYSYYWKDERPGRHEAYFRAEVLNDAAKNVWAYSRDSRSN
jgi:hypothetical protein